METTEPRSSKNLIRAGLILLPVMLSILVFTSLNRKVLGDFFEDSGGFFINYILAGAYFLFVLIRNRPFFKFRQIDRRLMVLVLTLFSISSFTLNNYIVLFAPFTLWVKVYLLAFYAAYLGLIFRDKLPRWVRYLQFFLLGAGLLMTLYFTIYLAPTYLISLVGLLFFGLTIHLLIPLFVSLSILQNFIKTKKTPAEKRLFFGGVGLPVLLILFFLFQWNTIKKDIHEASASLITRPDNSLPEWVLLCQDMPSDPFSQKVIQGSLVYDTFQGMWRGWGRTAFDDAKKHDPLVNIGLAVLGDIQLDTDARIKILKSQFNARHLAQRKLWSGRNLGTIEVLNNIKVYPDYRLAYTEKIITVKNFNTWEGSQQEAAFTFYLPEGSVASSLSLWIDGKEEQSRLTTKEKADSAYVTVVGVESRDPALMHWQEGNTLTVTVFPCTPKENRKFKIGITTPLAKTGDQLTLQNVYFEGPVHTDIRETSQVVFVSEQAIADLHIPKGFKKGLEDNYTYTGKFRPYWELSCRLTPLSAKAFSFNGCSYRVQDYHPEQDVFVPENIYLDLNKSWSRSDMQEALALFPDKALYVYHDKFIRLRPDNQAEVFALLSKKNFSLFPVQEVPMPETALLITKSTELSPNLSDLEGSVFLAGLEQSARVAQTALNVFQLGRQTSPYLKSLREFRVINLHAGTWTELQQLTTQGKFYPVNTNPMQVDLPLAGLRIVKDSLTFEAQAPDHLLRLFAYNSLMQQLGNNYFNQEKANLEPLVELANEAYIVTPVSSLIVLETQKDYERFDIPENENSLKNATMHSSGAVPEPEEWLLIALLAALLGFLYVYKQKNSVLKWR